MSRAFVKEGGDWNFCRLEMDDCMYADEDGSCFRSVCKRTGAPTRPQENVGTATHRDEPAPPAERAAMACARYASPLGELTMESDGESLTGLWFEGEIFARAHAPAPDGTAKQREERLPPFDEARRWLDSYFSGRAPDFTPPISPAGSDFQRAVWKILLSIPFGHTMTYGEVAGVIARQRGLARMSAQAVGGAVGRNPISIIVPCHRVAGADGSLTGYGGGMDRKQKLLALEGVDMSRFFVPGRPGGRRKKKI